MCARACDKARETPRYPKLNFAAGAELKYDRAERATDRQAERARNRTAKERHPLVGTCRATCICERGRKSTLVVLAATQPLSAFLPLRTPARVDRHRLLIHFAHFARISQISDTLAPPLGQREEDDVHRREDATVFSPLVRRPSVSTSPSARTSRKRSAPPSRAPRGEAPAAGIAAFNAHEVTRVAATLRHVGCSVASARLVAQWRLIIIIDPLVVTSPGRSVTN